MIDARGITQVLAKCAAYDPSRFPTPTPAMVEAWLEHFESYPHVTLQESLDAVKVYYRGDDVSVPRPANISKIARALHQDAIERDVEDEQRAAWEALCDAKAGDGQKAITAGPVNPDPATAEQRRKAIEAYVAARAKQATVPGVQELNT